MTKLAILLLVATAGFCHTFESKTNDVALNEVWGSFKTQFGKNYAGKEETVRRMIFEKNVETIRKHNLEFDLGLHSYTLGLNKFADMTLEEFRAVAMGYKLPTTRETTATTFLKPSNVQIPDSVDWRTKGYVTDVKDQAQCGSCWAFSTTGSLEGQYFKKSGKLVSMSEQQLVDCSGDQGNQGCGGGWMDWAFEYVKIKGIETEDCYPYTATDQTCMYNKSCVVTKITGYTNIDPGNEDDLTNAIATAGPVSVAIDAGHSSFQLYKHGVYDEPDCSPTQLDHGVLAVGYGNREGKDYYIVKNSWGESWGDNGYIMMSRNKQNQCGIATNASYPLM